MEVSVNALAVAVAHPITAVHYPGSIETPEDSTWNLNAQAAVQKQVAELAESLRESVLPTSIIR
jgi:hypothetical protein